MSAPSPDAATKQRIIKHMNQDHQDSIRRYLEHHAPLSSFTARNATLTDISFSAMEIRVSTLFGLGSDTYYSVPITPKMESWAEARPRVVAMDHEAMAGLGRHPITVKTYVEPYGFMTVVFILCILSGISFCYRGNFVPGSIYYNTLRLDLVPRFAELCYHTIQPIIFWLTIVLHTLEPWWLATGRLRRHSVPTGSKLWWKWVSSNALEGFGAIYRFDRLVEQEEEKRAKAKH